MQGDPKGAAVSTGGPFSELNLRAAKLIWDNADAVVELGYMPEAYVDYVAGRVHAAMLLAVDAWRVAEGRP